MKYVDTPCGKAVMPESFEKEIEKMTDGELIESLIEDERKTRFIDPFKLQFVLDRGLYSEYIRARKKYADT
ncbi:MAG: hypothetical protein K2L51_04335 [Clostridiales bacterium]|nr:hypothetical protein [Clostridiales bacterium]